MQVIVGINAYHADASACIVVDGRLIAAAEEERFRRIKHWAGFPELALRYCLQAAGVALSDVDVVAVNTDPKANLGRKLAFTLLRWPSPALLLDRVRSAGKRGGVAQELERLFPGTPFQGQVVAVEHHRAHMASAFLVSPYDKAVVLSVDGFGDFSSTVWGLGQGSDFSMDGAIHFPHSLGIFYQALTQYLGFPNYGDEYKVMGLAPYGEPRYVDQLNKIVRLRPAGRFALEMRYFKHHKIPSVFAWEGGAPRVATLYNRTALEPLLGPPRGQDQPLTAFHKDLARSIQVVYEQALFHILNHLHGRYRVDALTLAGGCAMNSVANGKITSNTPFKQLYVQSAAGDAGGAVGAAVQHWATHNPQQGRSMVMSHAYWGPAYREHDIATLLASRQVEIADQGCQVQQMQDEQQLLNFTAQRIAAGEVIGWFQGRMEWGPRALGNRSILCDPRRGDMKEILNVKIKRRESFRPFAPAILREAVADWFEREDEVPFMMKVFPIRTDKRALIPAVTHVDGSGRLQTVEASSNPLYYQLIRRFGEITGVPILLNTSFNENEPVVCRPEEALNCYLRTKMDCLIMGNWVITREDVPL
ncbi:Carbamoyltransferase [Magnetococcus marinus MC-1]|uniref:Carbamoyltransferase n=1 Tax=Magnetococcus marinus (strain ATCC BAA-1437 / JCM 17883 / MC-1) TaxID=156889 RepID=A0L646_MAGMM|nr:carbamoyltransferase C-terminal domain-containing protein [Magnetococcus marinus]ABK43439.1 Carbamoyltransferase [Magnetococcus marinus MC-1]